MMYAIRAPASRRNSVFDSEQSPQKNPTRWSRTSRPTIPSSSRSPRYGMFSPRPLSSERYGKRIVEVAGDQEAVASTRPLGDRGDDVDGRDPFVGQPAQQPVLALHEVVRQLLDDVRGAVVAVADLDEADDVAVQPEHAVHARQRPVLEIVGERQQPDVRVIRRIGELQPHLAALTLWPAPRLSPRPTGRRAWPDRRRGCRCRARWRSLRRRRSGS